jgi:hypothetical protein
MPAVLRANNNNKFVAADEYDASPLCGGRSRKYRTVVKVLVVSAVSSALIGGLVFGTLHFLGCWSDEGNALKGQLLEGFFQV